MNKKISVHDFDNYTREDIINVLVKNQLVYKTACILSDLKQITGKNLWDEYETLSNASSRLRQDHIDYLKELQNKYGSVKLSKLTKEEIDKLMNLMNKIKKVEELEEKAYKKYQERFENGL